MSPRVHDDAWLLRWAPRTDARLRLVCFPHAGGSAVFYRAWAQRFPAAVEVVAVQYPGRMNRLTEAPIDDVGPMADAISEAVRRQVAPPFALFGHSMGALVAFETALRLDRDRGPALRWLFASGRKGPAHHRPGRRHLAPDDALFAYLRVLGGTDAGLFDQPRLRPILLPMLRSDFKLSETWQPSGAQVACPITAIVGADDPEVSVEEAAAWEQASRAGFQLRVFAGNHFYLLDQERSVIDAVYGVCRRQMSASPPSCGRDDRGGTDAGAPTVAVP